MLFNLGFDIMTLQIAIALLGLDASEGPVASDEIEPFRALAVVLRENIEKLNLPKISEELITDVDK